MKKSNKDVLKIERGIPIPDITKGSKWATAVRSMKQGDSFHVDSSSQKTVAQQCWYTANKFPDIKFTVRKYNGAYRCWRIK